MNINLLFVFFILTLQSLSINASFDINLLSEKIYDYTHGSNIKIYKNSELLKNKGYNNSRHLYNGENLILKSFIKKNDTVIDAGAHIGSWTKSVLDATNNQCTIYAFEPVPQTFQILKKLDDKVSCFNLALGKEETILEFNYFYKIGSDCSSFFNRTVLQHIPVQKIKVPVTYLDKFAHEFEIKHINFLKIDTEGAELDVLKGAQNLILNNMISIIQFEYGGTYTDAQITLFEVYQYLTNFNYLIFRIIPDGLIYIQEWNNKLENFQYSNYLAIQKKILF